MDQNRVEELGALARELSQAALDGAPPDRFWALMVKRLEELLPCARASIFQVSPKSGRLLSRYAEGVAGSLTVEPLQGIAGHAAATLEPYVSNEPYNDPRFSAAHDAQTGFRTRSLLAFPLLFHGQAVGVIELLNKEGGFKPEDEALVRRLSAHLSVLFVGMRLQEQQDELQRQLVQTEKMAALGRMAGGLAHEINNPTAAILGFIDILMREPDLPPRHLPTLLKVDSEGRRIADIVRNVLGYSRAPSGSFAPIKLSGIIKDSLELVAHERRRRHGLKVVEDYAENEAPVPGDPGSLKQVFVNLINNAMQAMDGNGGQGLTLAVRVEGARVVARVSDEGPGVPPELRDRLFEPFFTTKEEGKGTGLGLYVIKKIVEAHGGELLLMPSPRGATFAVSLPAATSASSS